MTNKYYGHLHRYRWFAVLYLLLCFLLFPSLVFALSMAGWKIMTGIGIAVIIVVVSFATVKILQGHRPDCLPVRQQNWDFLPVWMTSLQPLDDLITRMTLWCRQIRSMYFCYQPNLIFSYRQFLTELPLYIYSLTSSSC